MRHLSFLRLWEGGLLFQQRPGQGVQRRPGVGGAPGPDPLQQSPLQPAHLGARDGPQGQQVAAGKGQLPNGETDPLLQQGQQLSLIHI